MHDVDTLLGQPTRYGGEHDPSLLRPLPRAPARLALGIGSALPFVGVDIWNAYEFSWLDQRGRPQIAVLELRFGADSPRIIESKSLKLYLGGFAQSRWPNSQALMGALCNELIQSCGATVSAQLFPADRISKEYFGNLEGTVIDDADIDVDCYGPPRPEFLRNVADTEIAEQLVSHQLKSNCPVTGQPDWASVQISYRGPRIDRAGLLRYLVSFREHSGFHEDCVERVFIDLTQQCAPTSLTVYARYTRRGGIDINPWRSTHQPVPDSNLRTLRQ